jgi:hypothetical protein
MGLAVPLWWTPLASALSVGLFFAFGDSQAAPNGSYLLVAAIPSLIVGGLAGVAVTLLMRRALLLGWTTFVVCSVASVLLSLAYVDALDVLPEVLQSRSTWALLVGSVVAPLIDLFARRRDV